MANLLTADQRAAIEAGRPFRMEWYIRRPRSKAHTTYDDILIDAGLYGDTENQRIVDPGRRSFDGINFNPRDKSTLRPPEYTIEVRNDDGYFDKTGTDTVWYYSLGTYTAWPQECYLIHKVYVKLLDGTWNELDIIQYTGHIKLVEYSTFHRSPMSGTPSGDVFSAQMAVAVIQTEMEAAWNILRHVWNEADGAHTQVTDVASGDADDNL